MLAVTLLQIVGSVGALWFGGAVDDSVLPEGTALYSELALRRLAQG